MAHIVEVRNIHTMEILERVVFEDATEALDFAFSMNEIMKATPVRYVFMN